jgi:beta-lactamase class A
MSLPDDELGALIDEATSVYPAAQRPVVSVCLQESGHPVTEISPTVTHRTASLMKVPVMGAVYQLTDSRELALDEQLTVQNDFPSMADHRRHFSIDPTEDADPWIYSQLGQPMALSALVERMICLSSNLATNIVFTRAGQSAVAAFLQSAGTTNTRVPRAIEDMEALQQGQGNVTTARDMATIMSAIWMGQVSSPKSRDHMLGHLSRQTWNDELPARLPAGTRVMHKTGWLNGIVHDAAIVEPRGEPAFTLAVLSSGWHDDRVGQRLLQCLGLAAFRLMTGH